MREILGNMDVAQIAIWLFWLFFAGLVIYLRREDRREGYPLEADTHPGKMLAPSLIFYPAPKTFRLANGASVKAPSGQRDSRPVAAQPTAKFPGAPLAPTGASPMLDSVGPGSWAERADAPEMTYDNHLKIVPVRVATGYSCSAKEDPRGYDVIGADRKVAGKVVDLWVDRSEALIRYFEVALPSGRSVLLPVTFSDITRGARPGIGRIKVEALLASQFADVPATRQPDSVTRLEEERICAYYGAGTLYATPDRAEPLL
ncbi:photosynthetic reaction center subunit H [Bosea sp. R86505]|uniref:photosynthetic reaction center subunit H n=1 Tax=Bosea sp. R86505 TaxID=3101710 RepID=UPI0036712844